MSWRHKAERIIAAECFESWRRMNHSKSGRRYKKHRPYRVPERSERLLACLNTNDEAGAKAIFIYEAPEIERGEIGCM